MEQSQPEPTVRPPPVTVPAAIHRNDAVSAEPPFGLNDALSVRIGQIGDGGLGDINGMSGCPIFGIEKARRDEQWIVEI
jgi:hypothetical protein